MTTKYYLIKWNSVYGKNHEIIEAENQIQAEEIAYQFWKDDAESSANYSAEAITLDELENYGYDPADYGLEPTSED